MNEVDRTAFIWELKAPQCFEMEPDNSQTRCRHTIDLIKAENQLIHYYHQARGDDLLRQRLKVMDPAKIEIGGIIIGRSRDRLNRGGNSQPDIERAVQSIEIRKNTSTPINGSRF